MQLDQYETLSLERDGALDKLWLNRPEALNAITTQTVSYTHLTLPTTIEV